MFREALFCHPFEIIIPKINSSLRTCRKQGLLSSHFGKVQLGRKKIIASKPFPILLLKLRTTDKHSTTSLMFGVQLLPDSDSLMGGLVVQLVVGRHKIGRFLLAKSVSDSSWMHCEVERSSGLRYLVSKLFWWWSEYFSISWELNHSVKELNLKF